MIALRTEGASLQPQPPPCAKLVNRMWSDMAFSYTVSQRVVLTPRSRVPKLKQCLTRKPWSRLTLRFWRNSTTSSTCEAPESSPRTTSPARSTFRCWTMPSARRSARSMFRTPRFAPGGSAPRWVARNVARHLETALADRSSSYKPLVYCWRGGQRVERHGHHPWPDRLAGARPRRRLSDLSPLGAATALR